MMTFLLGVVSTDQLPCVEKYSHAIVSNIGYRFVEGIFITKPRSLTYGYLPSLHLISLVLSM